MPSCILVLYVKLYMWLNVNSSLLTAECGKGHTVLTSGRNFRLCRQGICYELLLRTSTEQNSSCYLSAGIGFLDNYMNYCRLQANCLIVPKKNICGLLRFESWCRCVVLLEGTDSCIKAAL